MEETEKNIPKETESAEEVKTKSTWQIQKESWYDKVPLNLKQLDIIIAICLILLYNYICAIKIALVKAKIYAKNPLWRKNE